MLAVSETLEVGDCIVGGVKVARFTVTNHGGAGRFVLMATDSWPCSSAMVCALCIQLRLLIIKLLLHAMKLIVTNV